MKPYEQTTDSGNAFDQLDQVRMSPAARKRAKAYLRLAELLADMLMRVDAQIRRVCGFVGHGVVALAHRSKVPAARPEPN